MTIEYYVVQTREVDDPPGPWNDSTEFLDLEPAHERASALKESGEVDARVVRRWKGEE
jgi:hypothetical protein